jgi:hypothetical protein
MEKKGILTVALVLFITSFAWAGDSVTISMSCTIPAIPGVNAPPLISERSVKNKLEEVAKKNTDATEGEQLIEKEETKEILLAQGEKVTARVKTIYTR